MGNLPPPPTSLQYSTPNRPCRAAPQATRGGQGRKMNREVAPSGLHADELAVKPPGTSTNRTASAASDAPARTVRNNRDENRRFFQNPPPPDGPRTAAMDRQTFPPAAAHAHDSGTLAAAGTPGPVHSPDIAAPPATPTNAAPPGGSPRCNSVPDNEGDRTAAHTPSTGRSAHGNESGLAAAARRDHAEPRPREPRLPKVKSRRGAIDPTPGRFLFATSCRLPSVQLNHAASTPPLATTVTAPGPHPAAIHPRSPWPPGPAKLAPS
jgi:hypothetical protein